MNFDLSKTQKMLQESARDFLKRECPISKVREIADSEDGHDTKLWTGIAEQGWTGLTLPEEHDGLALSLVDLAAVSEEMGRFCLPSPFTASVWASSLIAASDNAELKGKLLPDLALGESIATVALLEESSNWDLASVQMSAEASDSGVVLSGSKTLVLDAASASAILVAARQGDELIVAVATRRIESYRYTRDGLDSPILSSRFRQSGGRGIGKRRRCGNRAQALDPDWGYCRLRGFAGRHGMGPQNNRRIRPNKTAIR